MIAAALTAAVLALSGASCAEDDPCWTWATQGNRKRGVTLVTGRRAIVGPCRFVRLDTARRINWKATPKLRGDAYARRHGCKRD